MSPPRICIIDDNPLIRKLIRVTLETAGYAITEADDGAAALAEVARARPDLLLVDLYLPDTDGVALLRRIRALPGGGDIPAICLSGAVARIDELRDGGSDFVDFLTKPVGPAELLRVLRTHLTPLETHGVRSAEPRLLVVNDNQLALKLMRVVLEHHGYRVTPAGDAFSALDLAHAAPPDLILADVLMPRMDGFQFCQAVRADPLLDGVPVLLCSAAYTEPEDRDLARLSGANDLVLITPDLQPVLQALSQHLGAAVPPSLLPADVVQAMYTRRLARQVERLAQLNVEMTQRLTWQETATDLLSDLSDAVVMQTALVDVLDKLLYRLLERSGAVAAEMHLLDGGVLTLRSRVDYRLDNDAGPLVADVLVLERVLATREPLIVPALVFIPLALGGQPLGILVVAADTTATDDARSAFFAALGQQVSHVIEIAHALSELRRSRDWFDQIMASVADGVVLLDADERVVVVNQAAERLLGMPAAALLGTTPADATWVFCDEDGRALPAERRPTAASIRTGAVMHVTRTLPGGSEVDTVDVAVAPTHTLDGSTNGAIVSFVGPPERRIDARSAGELETAFRIMVEQLPAITFVTAADDASNVLYVSDRVDAMLGYTAAEIVGDLTIWGRVVHPEDQEALLGAMSSSHATRRPIHHELRLVRKDGRTIRARLTAHEITDDRGSPRAWQGVVIDVTDLRR